MNSRFDMRGRIWVHSVCLAFESLRLCLTSTQIESELSPALWGLEEMLVESFSVSPSKNMAIE